jgi:hypothetical protein
MNLMRRGHSKGRALALPHREVCRNPDNWCLRAGCAQPAARRCLLLEFIMANEVSLKADFIQPTAISGGEVYLI